jgi:molecular chaperone GrpE
MTDETEPTETPHDSGEPEADREDKRFEVKWQKKGKPSREASQATEAGAATEPTPHAATLQRELEEERRRVTELRDRWQRAAADLANLRRRTEQEKGEVEKFASMLLVQQLLPVLDNFDRALATIPGNLQMLTWIQGVMLIERHFRAILEQAGLAPIEAMGQPFNAHYHEAISERESDEAAPGTVLQEYQKGYTMHGRVIRPTLVEVARAPAAHAEPGRDEEQMPTPESTDERKGEEIIEEAETENVGP